MKSADLFCSDPSANTQQDRLHNLPNFVGGGTYITVMIWHNDDDHDDDDVSLAIAYRS